MFPGDIHCVRAVQIDIGSKNTFYARIFHCAKAVQIDIGSKNTFYAMIFTVLERYK